MPKLTKSNSKQAVLLPKLPVLLQFQHMQNCFNFSLIVLLIFLFIWKLASSTKITEMLLFLSACPLNADKFAHVHQIRFCQLSLVRFQSQTFSSNVCIWALITTFSHSWALCEYYWSIVIIMSLCFLQIAKFSLPQ